MARHSLEIKRKINLICETPNFYQSYSLNLSQVLGETSRKIFGRYSMNQEILNYLYNVFFTRRKILAAALALSTLCAILIVRFYNPVYKAESTLLVRDLESAGPMQQMSLMMGGLSSLEKDSFILSLKPMLYSEQVFNILKKKLKEKAIFDQTFGVRNQNGWGLAIKKFLFGSDYVDSQKFIKYEFLTFRNLARFETSLDAGSFTISFKSKNPKIAIFAVDILVDAVINYQLELDNQQSVDTLKFLKSKEIQVAQDWGVASQKIVRMISEQEMPANDEVFLLQLQNVQTLKNEVLIGQANREGLKGSLKNINKLLKDVSPQNSDGNNSRESFQGVIHEIARLEAINVSSGDSSPHIKAKITALRNRLQEMLKNEGLDVESAFDFRNDLLKQQAAATSELAKQNISVNIIDNALINMELKINEVMKNEIDLKKLILRREILLSILKFVSQSRISTQMQSETRISKMVKITNSNLVPHFFAGSKARVLVVLTFFIGLACILAVCFWDYSREVIYDKRQLKSLNAVTNLGIIPSQDYTQMLRHSTTDPWVLNVINIVHKRYFTPEQPCRIFVTSYGEADGKSTFSSLLAQGFSNKNLQTLLVDADTYGNCRSSKNIFPIFNAYNGTGDTTGETTRLNDNLTGIRLTEISCAAFFEAPKTAGNVEIIDCPPAEFLGKFFFRAQDIVIICGREGETRISEIEAVMDVVLEASKESPKFATVLTNVRLKNNLQEKHYGNYVAA
jgi:uncharacterized protein involved in exopolysaccharide biosynthesis